MTERAEKGHQPPEEAFQGHSLFGEEGLRVVDTLLALERGDVTVEEAGEGFSRQGEGFTVTLDRESLQTLAHQIKGGDFDEDRRIRGITPVSLVGKGGEGVARKLTMVASGVMSLEEAGDGFYRTRDGTLGLRIDSQTADAFGFPADPGPKPAPKRSPKRD
ncbi:MAG TPA: hypothetical protein VM077_03390 [Candidatus Limnocylindrales bacterium]|nr:hypothetical protein [Candidatus Limnocylindrales bacterium]